MTLLHTFFEKYFEMRKKKTPTKLLDNISYTQHSRSFKLRHWQAYPHLTFDMIFMMFKAALPAFLSRQCKVFKYCRIKLLHVKLIFRHKDP